MTSYTLENLGTCISPQPPPPQITFLSFFSIIWKYIPFLPSIFKNLDWMFSKDY